MFGIVVNGNAPLAIVIFEQQRIIHIHPGTSLVGTAARRIRVSVLTLRGSSGFGG
jgi:hypothetical protein